MNVIMNVDFNSFSGGGFTIRNPSIIPNTGETVWFDFKKFIKNKKSLKEILHYHENNIFIAEMLCKRYYENHIEVTIILFEEEHFKESFSEMYRLHYSTN